MLVLEALRLGAALAAGQAAKRAVRPSRVAPLCRSVPATRRVHSAPLVTAAAGGSGGSVTAAPAAGNATESLADAFTRLEGVKPVLVSTQQPVELVSLWGADERAVVFFARHFVSAGRLGWDGCNLPEGHIAGLVHSLCHCSRRPPQG